MKHPEWRRRLLGALAAVAMVGCAPGVAAPPQSELTSTRTPGRIVWHDLVTSDLARAQAFYGGLLGWTFEAAPKSKGRYVFIRHGGRVIGGMAEVKDGRNVSQWLSHISTDDVDRAVAAATAAGGRVAVKPFAIGNTARVAVLQDPAGAPFGVVTLQPGDPAQPAEASVNGWLWHELWTRDKATAASFYRAVVGYQVEPLEASGTPYEAFKVGGQPRGGLQQVPSNVQPNWLPYVRVENARALAQKASALGGRVLLAPVDSIRGGTLALVQDPTGAALALQEWRGKGGR